MARPRAPSPPPERVGRRLVLRVALPDTPERLDRLESVDARGRLRDLLPDAADGQGGPSGLGGRRIRRLCASTAPAAVDRLHGAVRRRLDPRDPDFVDRERDLALEAIRDELASGRPAPRDPAPRAEDLQKDGSVYGRRVSSARFVRAANAAALSTKHGAMGAVAVNPNEYFVHELDDDTPADVVSRALRRLPGVVEVWPEPVLVSGPARELRQGQAAIAPFALGIGPLHALGFDGRGVRIVVVEQGFHPHEDLPDIPLLMGDLVEDEAWHGTATLGVLCARPDGNGITGLAHGASVALASPWRREKFVRSEPIRPTAPPRAPSRCGCGACRCCHADEVSGPSAAPAPRTYIERVRTPSIADTIIALVDAGHVGPGDILLLELQIAPVAGARPLPVDCFEPYAAAVAHATSRGVVVVEAAGNGGLDLDTLTGTYALRDTGAILVGAAGGALGTRASHRPLSGPFGLLSNHGRKVVQYGPGERVTTTGGVAGSTAPDVYTDDYSGTSSASAVVAAGLAVLQSAWLARGAAEDGAPARFDAFGFTDWVLPGRGDEPAVMSDDRILGVQADLRRIVRDTWRLVPRIQLEDTVGATMPRREGLSGKGAALAFGRDDAGVWSAAVRLRMPTRMEDQHVVKALFSAFPAATLPLPALRLDLPAADGTLARGAPVSQAGLGPVVHDLATLPGAVVLGEDTRKHGAVCLMARLDADEDAMVCDADLANFWSYAYHVKYDPKLVVRGALVAQRDAEGTARLPFHLCAAPEADVAFDVVLTVTYPDGHETDWPSELIARAKLTLTTDDTDTRIPLDAALVAAGGVFGEEIWKGGAPLASGVFPADAVRPCLLTLTYAGDASLEGLTITLAQRLQGDDFTVGHLRWEF